MSSVISFQTVIPNLRLRSDAWRVFEANTVRNVLISSSTRASSFKKSKVWILGNTCKIHFKDLLDSIQLFVFPVLRQLKRQTQLQYQPMLQKQQEKYFLYYLQK